MEINISDYIIGRVLSVQYTNGKWRLVAYLSKSLSETEQNYKIYNKEILAVIKELEAQRYLLESTKFKFEIQIDYKNLEYFMKVQKLNWKQARQTLYLSGFDFTLKYVLRVSGVVHIRVEVHRNDSEMDRLVKQSQLQLMCCTVCLPHGHNFR